jgi:glycosyltransferase involved in cell wall biosynthesis
VDKSHGTELCLAEQIERLADDYDIHLYSNRVEDVDLSKITWHRVPMPPGPHLFQYVWWLLANRIYRWRDSRFHGLAPEVVYSAGVNCLDADLVSVHILFSKTRVQLKDALSLRHNPMKAWPLMIHRRIYYALIEWLENKLYSKSDITLIAVSKAGAQDIRDRFGPGHGMRVGYSYHGLNAVKFSPNRRIQLREGARKDLGLSDNEFAILLIGNDWRKKGLQCLLEAVARLGDSRFRILVVGQDSSSVYRKQLAPLGLDKQVQFLPPRSDVEFYYAAADVYAGPSLEDTFSLPPAEAMACGLAVITTRAAGVSEIIHHGEDGLVMEDPYDVETLSNWLGQLSRDEHWSRELGDAARKTAEQYTWERNAREMGEVLRSIVEERSAL